MTDLRPIDGNGHVPDSDGRSADYQAGYNQALLDMMSIVLKQVHTDLSACLERIAA